MADDQILEYIREDIRRIEGKMDAHIHDSSWIMERISRLEAESSVGQVDAGGRVELGHCAGSRAGGGADWVAGLIEGLWRTNWNTMLNKPPID